MKKLFYIIQIIILINIFYSCKKDKPSPTPSTQSVDCRDQFVGEYKVYDTIGKYLYTMTISKFSNNRRDSLLLKNFADTFNVKIQYDKLCIPYYSNISIEAPFPIYDYNGKRWALFDWTQKKTDNILINDTIRFHFKMSNEAFCLEDNVPYYACDCKQIAVKKK